MMEIDQQMAKEMQEGTMKGFGRLFAESYRFSERRGRVLPRKERELHVQRLCLQRQ